MTIEHFIQLHPKLSSRVLAQAHNIEHLAITFNDNNAWDVGTVMLGTWFSLSINGATINIDFDEQTNGIFHYIEEGIRVKVDEDQASPTIVLEHFEAIKKHVKGMHEAGINGPGEEGTVN